MPTLAGRGFHTAVAVSDRGIHAAYYNYDRRTIEYAERNWDDPRWRIDEIDHFTGEYAAKRSSQGIPLFLSVGSSGTSLSYEVFQGDDPWKAPVAVEIRVAQKETEGDAPWQTASISSLTAQPTPSGSLGFLPQPGAVARVGKGTAVLLENESGISFEYVQGSDRTRHEQPSAAPRGLSPGDNSVYFASFDLPMSENTLLRILRFDIATGSFDTFFSAPLYTDNGSNRRREKSTAFCESEPNRLSVAMVFSDGGQSQVLYSRDVQTTGLSVTSLGCPNGGSPSGSIEACHNGALYFQCVRPPVDGDEDGRPLFSYAKLENGRVTTQTGFRQAIDSFELSTSIHNGRIALGYTIATPKNESTWFTGGKNRVIGTPIVVWWDGSQWHDERIE